MHDNWSEQQHRYPLLVGRVPMNFSPAHNEIKVSVCGSFIPVFDSYKNSWVIMVTLPSQSTSIVKGTSLLILCHITPRLMSSQSNIKYLKSMGMILKLPS